LSANILLPTIDTLLGGVKWQSNKHFVEKL